MTRAIVIVLSAVLSAALSPMPAPATPAALTITQSNFFHPGDDDPYREALPLPLVVPAGQDLIHVNLDLEGHNVTADEVAADGTPLFASATINRFQATTLSLAGIPAGEYAFHCTIHPFMHGTLTIV